MTKFKKIVLQPKHIDLTGFIVFKMALIKEKTHATPGVSRTIIRIGTPMKTDRMQKATSIQDDNAKSIFILKQ